MKTVKAKGNSKKTPAKKAGAARATVRPVAQAAAKYEQPGAPWWKRVPAPSRKSI